MVRKNKTKPLAGTGHNSRDIGLSMSAKEHLKSFIERVEKLEEEKAGIASDIKDVFAEAKGTGYDVKTMKKIIRLRRMDAAERDEADMILENYKRALGMQPDLFEGQE